MRKPTPLTLGVLIAIVVVALQALLVPLFAGPAANLAPRDLPIAVAGPPPATAQLAAQLDGRAPRRVRGPGGRGRRGRGRGDQNPAGRTAPSC